MTTPAGWYDDGSGNQRWWDGAQWTAHVVTGPQQAAAAPEPSSTPDLEPAAFAPPFTMPSREPHAPASVPGPADFGYPAPGGGLGAPWSAPTAREPAAAVPVVGIIGLIAVVVGVVCACIPMIAIAGWSLLAIGFVMSLVSLFLRGRKWPGITGLAVAAVGAVLAVAVSFLVLATTSGAGNGSDPFAVPSERPPSDDDSTSEGEDPSAIEGAEMVPFDELEVGDCLPFVDYGDEDQIFELPVVPCDQLHSDEIYLIFQVDDGEFPGDDALGEAAWDGCVAEFEAFVGIPYEESVLDIYTYQPTRGSWARADDRTVHCIVFSYEDVTGTLEGSRY